MLNLVRALLRRFILDGDVETSRTLEQMTQDLASHDTQLGSHSGRIRSLENDVLCAKNVAERLQRLDLALVRIEAEFVRLDGLVGLLKNDLERVDALREGLSRSIDPLVGRLKAAENSASAANSRCERIETRLGRTEHFLTHLNEAARQIERMDLPASDEDAEPPVKQKVCPTCRGTGELHEALDYKAAICPSCIGEGHVEVIPG